MNVPNIDQIVEMQNENYAKRIGVVHGDFRVTNVAYDWESRKQIWTLECIYCGCTRITRSGKKYASGENKGVCACRAVRKKEKERELRAIARTQKQQRPHPFESDKYIDHVIMNNRILFYNRGNSCWRCRCELCGAEKWKSPKKLLSGEDVGCICDGNYGKYGGESWVGKKYNHLTIIAYENGRFTCVCDCGNIQRVKPTFLLGGTVKTCGMDDCPHHRALAMRMDGASHERLYGVWRGMMYRCNNSKATSYQHYGGRGIAVCKEWEDSYDTFRGWALANGYSDDLSIDRINNDGNYEPSNCRWATLSEQMQNQRPRHLFKKPAVGQRKRTASKHMVTIGATTKSLAQWCDDSGISYATVLYRVNKRGMTYEDALNTPLLQQGRPRTR